MQGSVVCFGELLLRLGAPGAEPLLATPRLQVCYGGAEANVAVGLAHLGHSVRMVSVLPQDNPLADATLGELRRHGVDVSQISRAPGRMGLYFYQAGAMQRPAEVLYDRAGSAFALAVADAIDWRPALRGAALLHVSGITPALGPKGAAAALRAVRAARRAGIQVSLDGNFRAKLWAAWEADPAPILRGLLENADVLFGDHRDLGLMLGQEFSAGTPQQRIRAAAAAAFAQCPTLRTVVCTLRSHASVSSQQLGALAVRRDGVYERPAVPLEGVIDRIGAGDAFAAGVVHGMLNDASPDRWLALGQAAACLKHALPGDCFTLGPQALADFLADGGLDVKR